MAQRGKAISIYLSADAEAVLTARERGRDEGGRSEVIRRALLRYDEVCRRDLPRLSVAEWKLCVDALNGCWLVDSPASWAGHEISDAVSLNQSDAKWGVDWASLQPRLAALTYGQWVALVDTAERYWAAVGRGEDPKVPGEDTCYCHGCGEEIARSGAVWHDGNPYCAGCEAAPEEE